MTLGTIRVGFLGNCQAQTFEGWVRQVPDQIEVVPFAPIWLAQEEDVPGILERIDQCDVLFAQRLSDDFARPELATSRLKQAIGDRLVSWPNAYFDGYYPGISYRYTPTGRVLGALDEYHWDMIEQAWREGISAQACVARLTGDAVFDLYPDPVGASLANLAGRERGLNVGIADYIASHLHTQRLFYSMNHPVNGLLFELLHRLFGHIAERKRLAGLAEYGFPLHKIVLPVLPAIARRYAMSFGETDRIKGVDLDISDTGYIVTQRKKIYDYNSLVSAFYSTYDRDARQP